MSVPASFPTTEHEEYRPLSLVAVCGFGLGLLSLFTWMHIPDVPSLLFPLPALAVSLYARWRISRAEGTLAGAWLATAGLALGVINSLGWLTANQTAQWLLIVESRTFVDSWLKKAQEGKQGAAYLDTRDPRVRRVHFSPEDHDSLRTQFPAVRNSRSDFDDFRRLAPIQSLLRQGTRAQWRHAGVQAMSWRIDEAGSGYWVVTHIIDFESDEIRGQLAIPVRTRRVHEQNTSWRDWEIMVQQVGWIDPGNVQRNPRFDEVRRRGIEGLYQLLRRLQDGGTEEAILSGLPHLQADPLRATDLKILLHLMHPANAPPVPLRRLHEPLLLRYDEKERDRIWELTFADELLLGMTFLPLHAVVEVRANAQGKITQMQVLSLSLETYRSYR